MFWFLLFIHLVSFFISQQFQRFITINVVIYTQEVVKYLKAIWYFFFIFSSYFYYYCYSFIKIYMFFIGAKTSREIHINAYVYEKELKKWQMYHFYMFYAQEWLIIFRNNGISIKTRARLVLFILSCHHL